MPQFLSLVGKHAMLRSERGVRSYVPSGNVWRLCCLVGNGSWRASQSMTKIVVPIVAGSDDNNGVIIVLSGRCTFGFRIGTYPHWCIKTLILRKVSGASAVTHRHPGGYY